MYAYIYMCKTVNCEIVISQIKEYQCKLTVLLFSKMATTDVVISACFDEVSACLCACLFVSVYLSGDR